MHCKCNKTPSSSCSSDIVSCQCSILCEIQYFLVVSSIFVNMCRCPFIDSGYAGVGKRRLDYALGCWCEYHELHFPRQVMLMMGVW